MAKMTKARVDRWQKDLDKAASLVRKTMIDVGGAKLTTSGSIYSDIIDLGGSLKPALTLLEDAIDERVERSPIARIRSVVAEAAQRRKDAKAAKEAEKAAQS